MYTVEFSTASKQWVIKDVYGRVIGHYRTEGGARIAAAKEGRKTGRRTTRSIYDNRSVSTEDSRE